MLVSSSPRKSRLPLHKDTGHLPSPHSDPGSPESTPPPRAGVTRAGARVGSPAPPPPHLQPHHDRGRQAPGPLYHGVTPLPASASYPVKWEEQGFQGFFFFPLLPDNVMELLGMHWVAFGGVWLGDPIMPGSCSLSRPWPSWEVPLGSVAKQDTEPLSLAGWRPAGPLGQLGWGASLA